jgi:hypothetical protein
MQLAVMTLINRQAVVSGTRGDGVSTGGSAIHVPWTGLKVVMSEALPIGVRKGWTVPSSLKRFMAHQMQSRGENKIPTKSVGIVKSLLRPYEYLGDINDLDACTADQRSRVVGRAAAMTADEAEEIWRNI